MKKYRIQKQFIPTDTNTDDPTWAKRQIWVYKINGEDQIDEFDTLTETRAKISELEANDPTNRVYRIAKLVSGSYIEY